MYGAERPPAVIWMSYRYLSATPEFAHYDALT
jgi:hypothetical protein